MKMTVLSVAMIFAMGIFPVFAQEQSIEVRQEDMEVLADHIDSEADRQGQSPRERRKLRKVGQWFRDAGIKTGRALGAGSSVVFTETLRPFIATGSFFRGAFSRLDSQDTRMRNFIYNFYADNEEDLQELYRNKDIYARHLECDCSEGSIYEDFGVLVVEHFKNKALGALKDILGQVGFNPIITDPRTGLDINLLEASSLEELMTLIQHIDLERNQEILLAMMNKEISNDLIRETLSRHNLGQLGEYIDIEPLYSIVGMAALGMRDLSEEDLLAAVDTSIIEELKEFGSSFIESEDGKVWKNKKLLSELGETAGGLVAQFAVPNVALGIVTGGVGSGLYTGVVGAAAIGTGISVAVCSSEKGKERILEDIDFRNFCSYLIFRNSLKLAKSKSKGFLAGQNFRKYLRGLKAARIERREEIRSCRESGGSRRECRRALKAQVQLEIEACMQEGKTKSQCKRERREVLRQQFNLQ